MIRVCLVNFILIHFELAFLQHYVPLNEMATDVEEKMKWIIDNDEAAKRISKRATLWMEDLVFHPDARKDDLLIREEIVRRYRAHFMKL